MKIYLVSDGSGTPILVTDDKFKATEFCGDRMVNSIESHIQIWENEEMKYENWVTGNYLLKIDKDYPLY